MEATPPSYYIGGYMTKKQKMTFGKDYDNLSESEEVAILKAKNGSVAGTLPLFLDEGLIELTSSYTGGIGRDIWRSTTPDMVQLRNLISTYFARLFKWSGSEDVDRHFIKRLNNILFRNGKAALVKFPDGKVRPVEFTWNDKDEDFYGNPSKITIITTNAFNGRIFRANQFVIINNNHNGSGTLTYMWERMRQTIRALRDVDNNSVLSAPKWGVGLSASDAGYIDVAAAMNSNKPIIPLGGVSFTEAGVQDLTGEDRADSKINIYEFQLKNLLKMIGLEVNSAKMERQTELELSKNDEFDGFILQDMYESRLEVLDEVKEKLDFDLRIEFVIEEVEENEETELNGEVHKRLEEVANAK